MKLRITVLKLGLVAISGLILSACSGGPQGTKLEDIKACYFPDTPKEKAPLWVCSTQVEGYAAVGVGSFASSSAGIDFAKRQAIANARAELASQLKTQITNAINSQISQSGMGTSAKVDTSATVSTSQLTQTGFSKVKVIRTVVSQGGVVYALVGLTKDDYEAALLHANIR